MSTNPPFLNKIFLLEKKLVIYEKALDSLMVLNIWVSSVLLCSLYHSQEGPPLCGLVPSEKKTQDGVMLTSYCQCLGGKIGRPEVQAWASW